MFARADGLFSEVENFEGGGGEAVRIFGDALVVDDEVGFFGVVDEASEVSLLLSVEVEDVEAAGMVAALGVEEGLFFRFETDIGERGEGVIGVVRVVLRLEREKAGVRSDQGSSGNGLGFGMKEDAVAKRVGKLAADKRRGEPFFFDEGKKRGHLLQRFF